MLHVQVFAMIISTYLQHVEYFYTEFVVKVSVFGARHVIDKHHAVSLCVIAVKYKQCFTKMRHIMIK